MAKITVVIVDDHPLFRQGVVDAFSLEKDLKVLGQAASGNEALALIKKLQPHIAVIDVNLPELNGQQLTRYLREAKVPTRVVLLTGYDDYSQVVHSMAAGAAAYCVKDIDPQKLVQIVKAVSQGKYVVSETELDLAGLQR